MALLSFQPHGEINFVPPNAISTGTEVTDVPRREQDRGGISRPEAVSQVDAAVTSSQASLKIVAHGVVKDPDIVLLSDATNKDSEALIVQEEVEFDFNMDSGKQELSSKLSRLQMQAAQFPDVKSTS